MEISLITCLRSLGSQITQKKHYSLSWTLQHQNPQKSYTTAQNSKTRKDKEWGFACWNLWLKFRPKPHKRSHTCRWSKWDDFGQSPKWKQMGSRGRGGREERDGGLRRMNRSSGHWLWSKEKEEKRGGKLLWNGGWRRRGNGGKTEESEFI